MSLQIDKLSPESLQLFSASLAGLSKDEIRKTKVLYLRNAISEFKATSEAIRAFGCLQIFFAIIPVFWPILYIQRRMINTQRQLAKERILNAIDVWKDDLGDEKFDFS